MSASIVEKYEQILAADPRSRIFVELARALLDKGDAQRAIEVCQQGLEHHPSSILGRVIWGRALLERGDPAAASDQFDIAIAIDPARPYAYNLIGEALLAKGQYRQALPVLARAAELQPADPRVRGWLEEARRRAAGGDAGAAAAQARPRPLAAAQVDEETTEPYRPIAPRPEPQPERSTADTQEVTIQAPLLKRVQIPASSSAPTPIAPLPAPLAAPAPARPVQPAPAAAPAAAAPPAPPVPPPAPPPIRASAPPAGLGRDELPRSLLSMLPGTAAPARPEPAPAPARPAAVDEEEAQRVTAEYEQRVRERFLAEDAAAPPPGRRWRWLALAAVLVAVAGGAWLVLSARTERLAQEAAPRARAGLARDTAGALAEAADLLAAVRRSSGNPELTSLAAQIAAVRAVDYGDAEARALATALIDDPDAGDGALVARALLATSAAERKQAEQAVLTVDSAEPMVKALGGRILLSRGEAVSGRARLEQAAQTTPPLLRALADLGDAALAAGDAEAALTWHGTALTAHPTYPRAAVGAAEARLALGRDLDGSRRELAAVEADAGSTPPLDLRLRFELASARVLAATGAPADAAARLGRAAARLGESAPLLLAVAEVQLAARAWDRAEAAAARATVLAPGDVNARALLARARIARGRYVEALAAAGSGDDRTLRTLRGVARLQLGQIPEARAELERTARDGKMPAEAAVWYAVCDLRSGKAARARELLERLSGARAPQPLTAVALGQALAAEGRGADAEAAFRAAIARDAAAPEPRAALGALLLARGDATGALPELQQAVSADPADLEARRSLAAAELAAGHPPAARAAADAVLLARPADLEALRIVSAAWLAEGQPREARRAAARGLARAPDDPRLLMAAARAADAQGDRAGARTLATRAVKAAGRGPLAPDARAALAEVTARRR
ncbi:MAG: tetratricopeptide repeat protein [Anaeromyxobacter sp.]